MRQHRKHETSPVLAPDIVQALAAASVPAALPPTRKAAIAERLFARVRADAERHLTVRRDDGEWQQLAPDVAMKVLDSRESMQAFLLRLDPGACLPAHPHPQDEMCYVLEGEAALGDFVVGPGDYHLARAGSAHGDVTTRTGCVLLIRIGA